MFENSRVLLVAAHPDDEVLGVGASLHQLVHKFKCTVRVVILGEGITSRDTAPDRSSRAEELNTHRKCIYDAQRSLGYQEVSLHQLPDNRFDSIDLLDIVKIVESEKLSFDPDYIFTHHCGDLNIDHRLTSQAVLTATRPVPGERVKGIIFFETFSATEWSFTTDRHGFRPNFFFPATRESLAAKLSAMAAYKFETRESPHPRSLKSLEAFAVSNGSKVGLELCESFEIGRLLL